MVCTWDTTEGTFTLGLSREKRGRYTQNGLKWSWRLLWVVKAAMGREGWLGQIWGRGKIYTRTPSMTMNGCITAGPWNDLRRSWIYVTLFAMCWSICRVVLEESVKQTNPHEQLLPRQGKSNKASWRSACSAQIHYQCTFSFQMRTPGNRAR